MNGQEEGLERQAGHGMAGNGLEGERTGEDWRGRRGRHGGARPG